MEYFGATFQDLHIPTSSAFIPDIGVPPPFLPWHVWIDRYRFPFFGPSRKGRSHGGCTCICKCPSGIWNLCTYRPWKHRKATTDKGSFNLQDASYPRKTRKKIKTGCCWQNWTSSGVARWWWGSGSHRWTLRKCSDCATRWLKRRTALLLWGVPLHHYLT